MKANKLDIFTTESIRDILSYVSSDSLVLFDIDNTLIRSIDILGTEEWERFLFQKYLDKGLSEKEAQILANKFWRAIQPFIEVELVESAILEVLSFLRRQQIPYFGLTARSVGLEELTHSQLYKASLPMPFMHYDLPKWNHHIEVPCGFHEGILFCGDNHKGSVFHHFFHHLPSKPNKIIFIDDKPHHVRQLAETAKELGKDYIGFHYLKSKLRSPNLQKHFEPLMNLHIDEIELYLSL